MVLSPLQATTPMPPHTGMLPWEEGNPLLHDDNRKFFARSPSVTCLGAIPLSPFDPIWLGLPLVEKPHTLEPSQSKVDWFGYQQGDLLCCWPSCGLPEPPILRLIQFPPSRTNYCMHSTWPKLPETSEPVYTCAFTGSGGGAVRHACMCMLYTTCM